MNLKQVVVVVEKVAMQVFLSNLDLSEKMAFTLDNIDSLIKMLEKRLQNDKPVLILETSVNTVAIKYGFRGGRMPEILDEINNLLFIFERVGFHPHLNHILWKHVTQEIGIFFCAYVKPYKKDIVSLRDLAKIGSEKEFKEGLFQTLHTLEYLQKNFPGFRHNDFKADNIIITTAGKTDVYYFVNQFNLKIKFPSVCAKIIDFEMCTDDANNLKSSFFSDKESLKISTDFGLYPLIKSNLFDVHLLLYDCLNAMYNNSKLSAFSEFVFTYIDKRLFDKCNLTPKGRLNPKDQASIPNILSQLLCSSYFEDIYQN